MGKVVAAALVSCHLAPSAYNIPTASRAEGCHHLTKEDLHLGLKGAGPGSGSPRQCGWECRDGLGQGRALSCGFGEEAAEWGNWPAPQLPAPGPFPPRVLTCLLVAALKEEPGCQTGTGAQPLGQTLPLVASLSHEPQKSRGKHLTSLSPPPLGHLMPSMRPWPETYWSLQIISPTTSRWLN